MKVLGNFRTPLGVSEFGGVKVYDLRQEQTRIAQWAVLANEVIGALFVLLPADGSDVGEFAYFSGYIKWNRSLKVVGNILMASWWRGDDCSRTGKHGTQQVACLRLDVGQETPLEFSSGRVQEGTFGFDGLDLVKAKSVFPDHSQRFGNIALQWCDVIIRQVGSFSVRSGYSPDHMRQGRGVVPGRVVVEMPSGVTIPVKALTEVGDVMDYASIANSIREYEGLSSTMHEAILSEDLIRTKDGSVERLTLIRSLVDIMSHRTSADKKKLSCIRIYERRI